MARHVAQLQVADMTDAELRPLFEAVRTIEEEVESEGPTIVWDDWLFRVRNPRSWQPVQHWVATDGGDIVGWMLVEIDDSGANRNLATFFGGVLPGERRRGVASELLDAALPGLRDDGRTNLTFHCRDGQEAAEGFLSQLDASKKLVERRSRCRVDRLDRAMLEGWLDKASERAAEYSLLVLSAPTPEEHLERWAELQHVMNTAPLDDLDYEDEIITVDMIREAEQRMAAVGRTNRLVVAVHEPSGDWAGFTELEFNPHYPMMAIQEGTGVVPAHRDRGLGRWLKAANALWLLDERPEVEYIDTWNAFSNAPMLGINDAMGFEVVGAYAAWQRSAA